MKVIDADKFLESLEKLNTTREIKWFSHKELIIYINENLININDLFLDCNS